MSKAHAKPVARPHSDDGSSSDQADVRFEQLEAEVAKSRRRLRTLNLMVMSLACTTGAAIASLEIINRKSAEEFGPWLQVTSLVASAIVGVLLGWLTSSRRANAEQRRLQALNRKLESTTDA